MTLYCFWREGLLKKRCVTKEINYISLEENQRFRALNLERKIDEKCSGIIVVTIIGRNSNPKKKLLEESEGAKQHGE